jgi:hypothetical protein
MINGLHLLDIFFLCGITPLISHLLDVGELT